MGVYSAKDRKIQVSGLSMSFEGTKILSLRANDLDITVSTSDGRVVTVSLLGKRVNSDFILS